MFQMCIRLMSSLLIVELRHYHRNLYIDRPSIFLLLTRHCFAVDFSRDLVFLDFVNDALVSFSDHLW